MEKINYPSQEILNPQELTRKNYEQIILWMLYNNDGCEWSNFIEKPLEMSIATLSRHLAVLKREGFINKLSRGHYSITPEGKKRYHELSGYKGKERKISYPPEIILKSGRNYDHWILWMVYNNNFCKRSDFFREPLSINQSSLSKNINFLTENGFILKEHSKYIITQSGKVEYSRMLQHYDLDRQTILEEESKRIDEITKKTTQFFNTYNITDENIKFRYLNKVLKLDYSKVSTILTNKEDFDKILLFISINHPNLYPDHLSFEEFSRLYQIKKKILDFWVDEIVEGDLYDIKFFRLDASPDKCYFFQSDDKLEKMLQAITEEYITKNKYLQKFGQPEGIESLINNILDEICETLFSKDLMESLREFIPEYIKHLAYKIETKREIKGTLDKLEGIIWQNMANVFQSQRSETLEHQYKEKVKEIEKAIALNPKDFDSYNSKIKILIYFNQYNEVIMFLDQMLEEFPEKEIEIKMKKASILKIKKDVKAGLEIIEDLINKYPNNNDLQNYKAYWLQYLGNKEEALEVVQKLIKNEPDNATYQDTFGEILMYFEDYEEAAKKFVKSMVLGAHEWYIFQTYIKLGICYKTIGNLDLAVENLKKGIELTKKNVKDPETKQKWLTIANLFLSELKLIEINH